MVYDVGNPLGPTHPLASEKDVGEVTRTILRFALVVVVAITTYILLYSSNRQDAILATCCIVLFGWLSFMTTSACTSKEVKFNLMLLLLLAAILVPAALVLSGTIRGVSKRLAHSVLVGGAGVFLIHTVMVLLACAKTKSSSSDEYGRVDYVSSSRTSSSSSMSQGSGRGPPLTPGRERSGSSSDWSLVPISGSGAGAGAGAGAEETKTGGRSRSSSGMSGASPGGSILGSSDEDDGVSITFPPTYSRSHALRPRLAQGSRPTSSASSPAPDGQPPESI